MAWGKGVIGMARTNRVKKWFMLQIWRIQQPAQLITLVLLAFNLSLLLFNQIRWRGELLNNAYFFIPVSFILLFLGIWAVAIFWDLRLRLWREQATVLVERNPYTKERLNAKEIAQYSLIWIPALERLGREDKKLAEIADVLKRWIATEWADDPQLRKDVQELFKHIGSDRMDLTGLQKKQ